MSDVVLQNDVIDNEPQKPNKKINWTEVKRFLYSQKGWLFVLPAILLLCIFTFYPIVNTVLLSFKNNFNPMDINYKVSYGLANYKHVLRSGSQFYNALANTAVFTFIGVPLSTIVALLISLALSSIKKLQNLYQSILFLPYLTNSLAIGSVFYVMFAKIKGGEGIGTMGLVNTLLGTDIDWIQGSKWLQRTVVVVYEVWSGLPFKILILFGALQNVNKQYYDAAKVDGATKLTTTWRITVPLISPMISYLLITGFIGGFKSYSIVVGIFNQQIAQSGEMQTIVGLIYSFLGSNNDAGIASAYGHASAAALILFFLIMIFTAINFYVSKKKVHY